MEYGLHHDGYDALVRDLEAEDVVVHVEHAREERSTPSSQLPSAAVFYDLVIHVEEGAAAIIGIATLIEMVRRRLRARRQRRRIEPRRAVIHLPSGEEHVFSLDDE